MSAAVMRLWRHNDTCTSSSSDAGKHQPMPRFSFCEFENNVDRGKLGCVHLILSFAAFPHLFLQSDLCLYTQSREYKVFTPNTSVHPSQV